MTLQPPFRLAVAGLCALWLAGCALLPGQGPRDDQARAADPEPRPQGIQTVDHHDLPTFAAGLVSSDSAGIASRLAALQALPERTPLQDAQLGLILTRPGHPGFAPDKGLAALERALADSQRLERTDIQIIAAQMDLTQAWLNHSAALRQDLREAQRTRLDLERKIRALTEIEHGG